MKLTTDEGTRPQHINPIHLTDHELDDETTCEACDDGSSTHIFGKDPDGFVLCGECHAPLFYCDLGGQG